MYRRPQLFRHAYMVGQSSVTPVVRTHAAKTDIFQNSPTTTQRCRNEEDATFRNVTADCGRERWTITPSVLHNVGIYVMKKRKKKTKLNFTWIQPPVYRVSKNCVFSGTTPDIQRTYYYFIHTSLYAALTNKISGVNNNDNATSKRRHEAKSANIIQYSHTIRTDLRQYYSQTCKTNNGFSNIFKRFRFSVYTTALTCHKKVFQRL